MGTYRSLLAVGILAVSMGPVPAQTDRKPDPGLRIWTVRQANFTKDFSKAATGAEAILNEPAFGGKGYGPLRCDALLHLYYAQLRQKQAKAAGATFARFLRASEALPRSHALLHQMVEIREHFGLDPKAVGAADKALFHPPEDPEWSVLEPKTSAIKEALADLHRASKRAGGDGLLVARDGKILLEKYEPRYREPMMTMSSVKSMTGLLVGLAIQDGKLPGVMAPVGKYIPEWHKGERGRVTIEHLLTMTSGLLRMRSKGVPSAADKNAFVKKLTPKAEPGSRWSYSNEGVQLLGAVLHEAIGEPLVDYARRRLFVPLGMDATNLRTDRTGHANTFADARTTLRDFARLGVVMARGGQWKGKQVLPKAWLEASLRPCAKHRGYGYLWWLYGEDCFAMEGYLGTSVWIWPKAQLVVARVQSRPHLLADGPLDERSFRKIMARLADR